MVSRLAERANGKMLVGGIQIKAHEKPAHSCLGKQQRVHFFDGVQLGLVQLSAVGELGDQGAESRCLRAADGVAHGVRKGCAVGGGQVKIIDRAALVCGGEKSRAA